MAEERIDLNAGVLAPVNTEVTLESLAVSGQLPPGLNGTLLRNGPNPFNGRFAGDDMLSWWVEASMVHGLAIADGQAPWYRNRWVNSGFHRRHLDPSASSDPLWDHNPNVNIVAHADRLLALGEGGLPFELSSKLDTIGPTTFDGALTIEAGPTGMTAHPKLDPETGELFYFRADWQAPYLRYCVLDSDANLTVDQSIELPAPVMMHDFAITKTKALFLDLNVGYDFGMLAHGAAIPLRWLDDKPTRIGITPRLGGPTRWCEVTPCFIQHVINAYDTGPNTLVLDVIRYPSFLHFVPDHSDYEPNPLGTPWRYTIDLDPRSGAATVVETPLDDHHAELPRINDQHTGRPNRYAYAVEQPTDTEMRGIIKYDNVTGTSQRLPIPPGDQNSEPIFVPRRTESSHGAEDDGWLLTCVYRHTAETTDILVNDASDLTQAPLATIHLPVRIPAGFHGWWQPAT